MSLPATSVALLLLALLFEALLIARSQRARPGARSRVLLGCVLVAIAFVAHARLLGTRDGGGLELRTPPPQLHEFFHYYLGTRYFAELGYTGLYAATVLADLEDEPQRFRPGELVRDLASNRPEPRALAVARGRELRERFTPERWQAFKQDVALFREANPPELWDRRGYVMDHGYNGTPLTTLVLGGLANRDWLPSRDFIALMRWADIYLLALAGLLVAGLEGAGVGLLFLFFLFANPLDDYAFVGAAYLRFGWLLALAGALLALRRGADATAGALFALATGLRLFPVVIHASLVLHALLRRDRRERLLRQRRLHAGFAAAGLAIFALGAGVATPGGRLSWLDFADDIRLHGGTPAANRIGLAIPFAYAPAKDRHPSLDDRTRMRPGFEDFDWAGETRRVLAERRVPHVAVAGLALLATLAWLRCARERETFLPALALVFTAVPLAHYDWSVLGLLPLVHPRRRDLLLALSLLCGVLVALAAPGPLDERLDLRFSLMSLCLAAFLAFAALRATRARGAPVAAPAAALSLAALMGCGPPQPIVDGDVWRSRAFGVSIEKPADWVFLSETSLLYDARRRVRDRAEMRERLDWPGRKPLVGMASRADPVAGRDALVYVHVIPIRPNERERGLEMQLKLPAEAAVQVYAGSIAGHQEDFEQGEETRSREISGFEGAEVDTRYRTAEDGTRWPTLERVIHFKRGEEYWYVRRIGPDPSPPELEQQFERILASLKLAE